MRDPNGAGLQGISSWHQRAARDHILTIRDIPVGTLNRP
ncbi:hypothetical protein SGPA1_50365 [Streptomyces misionensis JCM 4497]